MIHRTLVRALVAAFFLQLAHAQSDTTAFRAASDLQKAEDKIHAFETFLQEYPASGLRGSAYHSLFDLYLGQRNELPTLNAARMYLESLQPDDQMNAYNSVAYDLALSGLGLDSALAYATHAEDMARTQNSGILTSVQDTKAYVLYLKGNAAEAEKLQQQAIVGHEQDPEFITHLALFQEANGKRREALHTLCKALFLGADPGLKKTFSDCLTKEEKDSGARDVLKASIVMDIVRASFDSIKGDRVIGVRSNAGGFMAGMGVHISTAQLWAEAAVASLRRDSPLDDVKTYRENLSLVQIALGKYKDALVSLRSVEPLASPWDAQFWMALGTAYEHEGEPAKAIDAYMQGLLVSNPKELRGALEKVYTEVDGSTMNLEADLARLKERDAHFEPGTYSREGPETGRVVLAELFTGTECGPCLGSDLAFDALKKYYPKSDLAILEYHVHVPRPDPMTTVESWKRFRMYGETGTPTAVINGEEPLVGGGPRTIVRNRFNLYRYAIDRSLAEKPSARLTLLAEGNKGIVKVNVEIARASEGPRPKKPVLHIALVERLVNYPGGNGITRHAFVVRTLFSGTPLTFGEASEAINVQFKLLDVEAKMKLMQENPMADSSWPKHLKRFNGWRTHPEELNPANLSVVAWVQDMQGNRVLQSAYQDVNWNTGENQRAGTN